jgi:hypothetical protein
MKQVVTKNRDTLKQINSWVDDEAFRQSFYNYGVPEKIKPLLDLNIGNEITYSDLILYYSRHFQKINYLELGVSVGKNFFQMAEGFQNAALTGFDIEDIHPVLKSKFSFIINECWKGKSESLRTQEYSFAKYSYKTNAISYLAADIWDENAWAKLKGNKFNIIFSDALHDPAALLFEYKMIEKYQLLSKDFLIFWDDLNNGLEESFYKICKKLKEKYHLNEKNVHLFKINGWLGKNYPIKHDVGIISNLPLN